MTSYMYPAIVTIFYHLGGGRWLDEATELVMVYWTSSRRKGNPSLEAQKSETICIG